MLSTLNGFPSYIVSDYNYHSVSPYFSYSHKNQSMVYVSQGSFIFPSIYIQMDLILFYTDVISFYFLNKKRYF